MQVVFMECLPGRHAELHRKEKDDNKIIPPLAGIF